MLRRVALVRTDVSEKLSASFHQCDKNRCCVRRFLVTDKVVSSSPILVALMEALSSFETSVLTTATRCTRRRHSSPIHLQAVVLNYLSPWTTLRAPACQVVEALVYKAEGRIFDTR
jgi:hypothetical protein